MLTSCLVAISMGVAGNQSSDPFHGAKWLTTFSLSVPIEKAKWIWVHKPGEPAPTKQSASPGKVTLVREFTGQGPGLAWFTADNRCTLKVNGREFKSDDWSKLHQVHGLVAGKNRVEVVAENDPGAEGQTNPAGFIFVVQQTYGRPSTQPVVSDSSWTSPDGKVIEVADYDSGPWKLAAGAVPAPEFRHIFTIKKPIKRAIAKVIGLGHYDIYANFKRKGDGYFNQPWSQYDKTIYWQEFDLTEDLYVGSNSVHVQLGNSWYRVEAPPPGRYSKSDAMPDFSKKTPYLLRAAIEIEYQDGTRENLVTGSDWKWRHGRVALSHVFAGEDHDARVMKQGFYDLENWRNSVIAESPKAQLLKMDWPEIRAKEVWKPIDIKNPKQGEWSYVFPQNASGILRFKVKGKPGQTVKFRPSEVMNEKGEVVQLNLWSGEASCSYTLSSSKTESYEWRFWYHGFQFVQVTGAVPASKSNPGNLPVLESVEMVHVRTDNPQIGSFKTSSDLYNKTHNLVDWAMKSNMSYVMTDCPQREKLGWQEQVHLLFPTFAYRYDTQAWFHKIARDLRDAQLSDGRFVNVAPDYLVLPPDNPFKFTVEWGASGVLMPWQAYQWYGDKRFLTENYASMKRFVDWLFANAKDGLAPPGLGDWYDYGHGQPPGPSRYTPTDLTSTATWAMCVEAFAKSSEALGNNDESYAYYQKWLGIQKDFLAKFYDPVKKQFKNTGSVQTGHAMALCANLVPWGDRSAVLQGIIDELESRGFQQTSGDIGHLYLIRALAEAGRSDVLHKVYSRTGVGSYGGILAKGLSTMPETWDAMTVGSNSLNHCMLGHVMEWFYGWVLGIRQAPRSVGWKHILIAPEPGDLANAKGGTATVAGTVSVEWKRTGHDFWLFAEIPKGSRATIMLPVKARILNVDGKPSPARQGNFGRASVEVGPGKHVIRFDS